MFYGYFSKILTAAPFLSACVESGAPAPRFWREKKRKFEREKQVFFCICKYFFYFLQVLFLFFASTFPPKKSMFRHSFQQFRLRRHFWAPTAQLERLRRVFGGKTESSREKNKYFFAFVSYFFIFCKYYFYFLQVLFLLKN